MAENSSNDNDNDFDNDDDCDSGDDDDYDADDDYDDVDYNACDDYDDVRSLPWKLLLQILKVFLVTAQLWIFASMIKIIHSDCPARTYQKF